MPAMTPVPPADAASAPVPPADADAILDRDRKSVV